MQGHLTAVAMEAEHQEGGMIVSSSFLPSERVEPVGGGLGVMGVGRVKEILHGGRHFDSSNMENFI